MCILIAGTVIFVLKYTGGSGNSVLPTGTTGTSTAGSSSESTSETTSMSTTESTAASTSESTTESTKESTEPKPEISVTPSPETSADSAATTEGTAGSEFVFSLSEEVEKLTSIKDLKAGTVVSKDQIDKNNLSQYFTSSKIEKGDSIYERINGKSYKDNKDIKLSDLRYLKMLHVNFDGDYQVGEMIVNKSVSDEVLGLF